MSHIEGLTARTILDSRGEETLEVSVRDDAGRVVSASVPHGKSAGSHEATTLPPAEAVGLIASRVLPAVKGKDPANQQEIDEALLSLDESEQKSELGGNTMLGVSVVAARLAAEQREVPLWQHFRQTAGISGAQQMPRLLVNVINGGAHADNSLPFQEYMVIPKTRDISSAVAQSVLLYKKLRDELKRRLGGSATLLGDEGGFAPDFTDPTAPFVLFEEVVEALEGVDVDFGLDAAANEVDMEQEEMTAAYRDMAKRFPLTYLEDPYGEDAFEQFATLLQDIGGKTAIVGDDLTVTNVDRIEMVRQRKAANGIIIKPNQVGTLSEALDAVRAARALNWQIFVSHRSGETNDDWIADLAVAIGADGFKLGAPARGERIAKYNRLTQIGAAIN